MKQLLKKLIFVFTGIEHPSEWLNEKILSVKLFFLTPFLKDKRLYSSLEDGCLRVRISSRCNGKCRFCVLRCKTHEESDVEKKWLYEYCRPLYGKVKLLSFTHGDFTAAPDAFNFYSMLCRDFPQATICTESNGIAFNEKWQKLAAENLFNTHFSLNCVSEEVFLNAVWEPGDAGGANAYRLIRKNVAAYIDLLAAKDRLCFAPSVSMVISEESCCEVKDFVLHALKLHAKSIAFFFDVTQCSVGDKYFTNPEMKKVLLEIVKIRSLLKDSVWIGKIQYIPWKEWEEAEKAVALCSQDELREQYSDIWLAAQGRSILKEHQERERWRKQMGKKPLTLIEDFVPTAHLTTEYSVPVCFDAWHMLDIGIDGSMTFCGWMKSFGNLRNFIRDGKVDWDEVFNCKAVRMLRRNMLKGHYCSCDRCCPVNLETHNETGELMDHERAR